MFRVQELVRLHRLGCGCREVARLLGMSPNTERKYREALEAEGLLFGDELPELDVLRRAVERQIEPAAVPHQEVSSLEDWRQTINEQIKTGAGPTAIFKNLRSEDKEFNGSLSAVKRLVHRIKQAP